METRLTDILSAGNPYHLLAGTDGITSTDKIMAMKQHSVLFLCMQLFCICLCTELSANPFTGNKNTTVRTEKSADFIIQQQSLLRTKLGDALYEWANTNTARTFWTIIWVAFFYGFMHALGPGHRKTLVFSFYLSRKAPVWEPAVTSLILVSLHSVMSMVLLLIFHNVSGALSAHTDVAAVYLEGISYLLLIILSIASLLHLLSHAFPNSFPHLRFGRAAKRTPTQTAPSMATTLPHTRKNNTEAHASTEHAGTNTPAVPVKNANSTAEKAPYQATVQKYGYSITHQALRYTRTTALHTQQTVTQVQWAAFLLSGLYPCPASVLVLVLVSNLHAVGIGIIAILSISAGMAVPVTAAAYLGWSGRQRLFKRIPKTQTYLERTALALGFAAYCIILIFSLTAVLPFIRALF